MLVLAALCMLLRRSRNQQEGNKLELLQQEVEQVQDKGTQPGQPLAWGRAPWDSPVVSR